MNIFAIFGTLQTEVTDVNVTIGKAMTEAISSNPVILALAIVLMIFFTLMMLQDLFKKVFIVFISIILLYMLASGDISTMAKVVVIITMMVVFVVKFGTYVIGGEPKAGVESIFHHLIGKEKKRDSVIIPFLEDILDSARYAWMTTFRVTKEGVKYLTYWKWK